MIVRGSRLIAALCGLSLLAATPAAAATKAASASTYSPWAALSAFTPVASQALCGSAATASAAAAASAAAQGAPGCVLPTVDAPVAAPVSDTAPLATPTAVAAGNSIGVLPLLVGLAALGGIAAMLLSNGDNGGDVISISP